MIDPTFNELKLLMNFPIEYILTIDPNNYIHDLIACKSLYETIIDQHVEDNIHDNMRDTLFSVLSVNDFQRKVYIRSSC